MNQSWYILVTLDKFAQHSTCKNALTRWLSDSYWVWDTPIWAMTSIAKSVPWNHYGMISRSLLTLPKTNSQSPKPLKIGLYKRKIVFPAIDFQRRAILVSGRLVIGWRFTCLFVNPSLAKQDSVQFGFPRFSERKENAWVATRSMVVSGSHKRW